MYNNIRQFLEESLSSNINTKINLLNLLTKKIDNKKRVQLYQFYDFLFRKYGLDDKYIKYNFENDIAYLNTSLERVITYIYDYQILKNRSVLHNGSGLGRNLPLLVYLGCSKVTGIDYFKPIVYASNIFLSLFTFHDKMNVLMCDFLNYKDFSLYNVYFYICGTILQMSAEESKKYEIMVDNVLNRCDIIIYERSIEKEYDDFIILNDRIKKKKEFDKIYDHMGFFIYSKI